MGLDRKKLKIEMIKRDIKSKDLAEKLGIDDSSFSLKLNNKRKFTEAEISVLFNIFGKSIF